jgi:hypothetical protein
MQKEINPMTTFGYRKKQLVGCFFVFRMDYCRDNLQYFFRLKMPGFGYAGLALSTAQLACCIISTYRQTIQGLEELLNLVCF